jgi:hypothetical protein
LETPGQLNTLFNSSITDTTMHPDLQRLSDAASSLLYMSETDAPLEVIEQQTPSTSAEEWVRKLSAANAGSPIETLEVDYFFRNQVRVDETSRAEERARAARFEALVALIHETLSAPRVYRTGSVQVDAFIIGTLQDGSLGGLRTWLVET